MEDRAGLSRRALLGGAAAVAAAGLAGCASDGASPRRAPHSTLPMTPSDAFASAATPDSDRDVALAALKDESRALTVYGRLADERVADRVRLRPLVAVQRRHVDALTAALDSTSAPHAAQGTATASPGPPIGAVGAVVTMAQRLAARRAGDCQIVESGSLASMLASMAAAHQVVAATARQWATTG